MKTIRFLRIFTTPSSIHSKSIASSAPAAMPAVCTSMLIMNVIWKLLQAGSNSASVVLSVNVAVRPMPSFHPLLSLIHRYPSRIRLLLSRLLKQALPWKLSCRAMHTLMKVTAVISSVSTGSTGNRSCYHKRFLCLRYPHWYMLVFTFFPASLCRLKAPPTFFF